jgi:hypothetical protein
MRCDLLGLGSEPKTRMGTRIRPTKIFSKEKPHKVNRTMMSKIVCPQKNLNEKFVQEL